MLCNDANEARAAIRVFALAYEETEKPKYWITWGCGMVMVTATAFAAVIALFGSPYIKKRVYDRLLAFLTALGVGNLTGCTLFVLFPRSMHISELGNEDYLVKSWLALCGCYLLFILEKLMDFYGEIKKKRKIKSTKGKKISVVRRVSQIDIPLVPTTSRETITPPGLILEDEVSQASSMPHTPVRVAHRNNHIALSLSPRNHYSMHLFHSQLSTPTTESVGEDELQSEALLALLSGWANNFIDGAVIGVAFGDSFIRGLTIGIAILSQQFPNELDGLVIMINTGVGLKRAMLLNLVQAVLSYIGFVIGVLIDNNFEQFDTYLYAVAAGNYLYICLGWLVPEMSTKLVESIKDSNKEGVITMILQYLGISIGLLLMFLMALNGNDITTNKKL